MGRCEATESGSDAAGEPTGPGRQQHARGHVSALFRGFKNVVEARRARLRARPRLKLALGAVLGLFALIGATGLTRGYGIDPDRAGRIEAAREVVWAVAQHGPTELARAELQQTYDAPGAAGSLPVLLAAWSRSSLGRLGWLDPLTSVRLPWLIAAALALPLLAVVARRARGPGGPWIALALTGASPAWVLGAARASDAWLVAASWLAALIAHAARLPPTAGGRARLGAALGTALAIAVGTTLHAGTLWLIPALLVDCWATTGDCPTRPRSRGLITVPAAVPLACAALLVAVPVLEPATWSRTSIELVRFAAETLGDVLPSPGAVALSRWALTTPVLALLGAAVFLPMGADPAATPARTRELRRQGVLALASLIAAALAAPAVGVELVTPFAAWFGALGLGVLLGSQRRATLGVAALTALALALAFDWHAALSGVGRVPVVPVG